MQNKPPPSPWPIFLRAPPPPPPQKWLHPSYSSREPAPRPELRRPHSVRVATRETLVHPVPKSKSSPLSSPPALGKWGATHPPRGAGMPAGKAPKGEGQASPASGGGRIDALPDETLHHILSFLPAQQVVRTCVLAQRWRHLWKSATGLRIVGADGEAAVPFEEAWVFVDSLLLLRRGRPLDSFELRVVGAGADIDVRRVRLWVSYAVECKVQVLRLSFHGNGHASLSLRPQDPPLASMLLTKLVLRGVAFNGDFLDLSRCPVLQDLDTEGCSFVHAGRISSQSLKRLKIRGAVFNRSSRTRIHTPNLTTLQLHLIYGKTPVLESMPLLIAALVVIGGKFDCCRHSNYGDCGDESCENCIPNDTSSVLFPGLSHAMILWLGAVDDTYIFIRDLKCCPTFTRLKSLTVNEQCVPNRHMLARILEHSPVLEELYLLLFYKMVKLNVIMQGRFSPKELPPTMSPHLKKVVVSCGVVDERVLQVLKFLSELIRQEHNVLLAD